jgi:hypothetical protein
VGRPRTATASPNGYATAIDPASISRLCCEARANDDMAKTVIFLQVRRERISERMRYLQELVPGCNKVTGKAGMLDEIINYVQSLQKQVEVRAPTLQLPPPWMQLCFLARCLFIEGLAVAAVLAVLVHEDRGIKPGGELQHRRGPLRPAAQPGGVQPCGSAGHGAADGAGRAFLPPDEPLAADANFCRILWLWAGDGRQ